MYKEQIEALRAKATAAGARMRAIQNGIDARGKDATPTEDEKRAFDGAMAEYDQTHVEIKRLEGLQRVADDEARAAATATGATTSTTQSQVVVRMESGHGVTVQDRAQDKPWAHFGEQLVAVRNAALLNRSGATDLIDPRLRGEFRAGQGMSEGVPSDGGFLVMKDVAGEIFKRVYETGQILNRCRTIPISAQSNGLKINGVDESSRATGSRWGGVRTYWQNEGAGTTATKAKFRQMELTLNKLFGVYYLTDEVIQDTVALGSIVQQAFTEDLSFAIEDAIIRGAGAGQPDGILNAGCLISVAKESGQTAQTFTYANLRKMWQRMWAKSRANAVWLINQDVEQQLYGMTIEGASSGVFPVYLPPGGASVSPYGSMFGRPVISVEYCDTLGTVGDVILADFSQYLVINKGGAQVAESMHVAFLTDEMCFRITYRIDGQPMWNVALTPYKGTNTVSPFVVLATRS